MNHREVIQNAQASSIKKLRNVELKVLDDNPHDMRTLKEWLKRNHFNPIYLTGELKECEAQYSRQIGKGRYHWRIYDFNEKIVIESHIDKYDPGRGFTKDRTLFEMLQDTTNHYLEDVLKEPIHNIIILEKSVGNSPDIISKLTSFLVDLLS